MTDTDTRTTAIIHNRLTVLTSQLRELEQLAATLERPPVGLRNALDRAYTEAASASNLAARRR